MWYVHVVIIILTEMSDDIVYSVYGSMRSLLCSYARAAADWWAAALSTWAGTCDGAELELGWPHW